MTQRKIVSLLLAVIMLLGLSAPAFAEGEPGAPPPAEATAEAPPAVEMPPASNEIVSAEDTVTEDTTVECVTTEEPAFENENADDGIMTVSVAPVSMGGVTVNLTGALEGLDEVIFENTDNDEFYHATSSGIWWDELPEIVTTPDKAVIHHVVQAASSLPTQFVVRPGGEVRFWTQGEYGITVDNGTIVSDETNSWYGGGDAARNLRCITVTTPSSGTMNVNVYADGAEVAQVVPYTFNNEDWENGIVVGPSVVIVFFEKVPVFKGLRADAQRYLHQNACPALSLRVCPACAGTSGPRPWTRTAGYIFPGARRKPTAAAGARWGIMKRPPRRIIWNWPTCWRKMAP